MSHTKHHYALAFFSHSRFSLIVCSFLLAFLLTACNLGGGSTGTTSSTTSSTTSVSPSASPSTPPAHPTSAPAVSMKTYVGDGFQINYPAGWTVVPEGRGNVTIRNLQAGQGGIFDIGINPAGGKVPATEMIQFALAGFKASPHYQKVDIAPTATVGGDAWDQIAATGDSQVPGQAQLASYESVTMADVHPAASPTARGFEIRYSTDASNFAQMNASSFQPMLQSFQFT